MSSEKQELAIQQANILQMSNNIKSLTLQISVKEQLESDLTTSKELIDTS